MGDTYYLQPPQCQQFYRYLATWMTWLAVGDQVWWGLGPPKYRTVFSFNRFLMYTMSPVLLISQGLYLYMNYTNLSFDVKGAMFAIIPVTIYVNLIVASTNTIKDYKKAMNKFMDKIHLCSYPNQDRFVKIKRIQVEKRIRFVSYFLFSLLILDWFAWCSVTGFNSYKAKDFIHNHTKRLETVIYIAIPIDYEYNFTNWLYVHTCNVYFVLNGASVIVCHNCVNYALVLQLIGHIEVLKHKIRTEFEGKLDDAVVKQKLVDVIKYHTKVLEMYSEIQSAFGFNVSVFYAYNSISDSLLLYQLMLGNDSSHILVYGPMISAYVGGLVLISFLLEEIRRQSDDISELVYDIDWASMSTSNQKMMGLLLMRVQPALTFTAFGGLIAGVKPMISIIKTSFSFYVMLKEGMKT